MKFIALIATAFFLTACGGGGGGGGSSYLAPSVVNTTYSGNTQTKTYSDGSTTNSVATSSTASYASDHVTRTTVYSYVDGGSNSVVDTVAPTLTVPTFTASVYSSNWTTTGTVTAPTVSAKNNVYGDGFISAVEDGSVSKPFAQSTLSALSITDPSKYVTSATTTYNLTWGVPDTNGPTIANLFPSADTRLSFNLSYAGITVAGQGVTGPTLVQPSSDVLAAWNQGWTGKDKNVLLIDNYADRSGCTSANGNCHGILTMMNVDMNAPGSAKFALDWAASGGSATGTAIKGSDGLNLSTGTSINVANLSFTAGNSWINAGTGAPSDAVYNSGITAASTFNGTWVNLLSGSTSVLNLNNLANAVITKAAGNDSIAAKYDTLSLALINNASTASRLLIVGALDRTGTTSNKASIATYSNTAGTITNIADRFVVANGTMPFSTNGVSVNGSNFQPSTSMGTSFAAPVVAGYAAVVMQKFPNLSAANTSNIILDTARTDTITGYSAAIHGKGEASLSRALAPVGSLR